MKLEPKHIIPYLLYSLKVIMEGKKTNIAWMSTKNIAVIQPLGVGEYKKINWKYAHLNIKPLLLPLSYLKDGIISHYGYPNREMFYEDIKNETVIIKIWNELLDNHYDVFDLIPNNLAIDKTTLK